MPVQVPRLASRMSPLARVAGGHLLVLGLVLVLVSALPRLMPGDPLTAQWTQGSPTYVADAGQRQSLQEHYGEDAALPLQVWRDVTSLVRGDAGTSIRFHEPVAQIVAERLPRTLTLAGAALALGGLVGAVLGTVAGWRAGLAGRLGELLTIVTRTMPTFFIAALALNLFAVTLRWFPVSGDRTAFAEPGPWWVTASDVLHHLALPAMVLAAPVAAGQFLLTRATVESTRDASHLFGAWARGASRHDLLRRHVLPAAIPTVAALLGVQVAAVLGGTVVVETIFARPGLGALLVEAIQYRDYPLLQASFAAMACAVLLATLLADLVAHRVDLRSAR